MILASCNKVLKYSSTEFQKIALLIAKYPTYATPYFHLGLKLEKQGIYTEALQYYIKCLEKGKSFDKAQNSSCEMLFISQQTD